VETSEAKPPPPGFTGLFLQFKHYVVISLRVVLFEEEKRGKKNLKEEEVKKLTLPLYHNYPKYRGIQHVIAKFSGKM
jgi:hypothetical protein